MHVFELQHVVQDNNCDAVINSKRIGFFQTYEEACNAIVILKSVTGFRNAKNGFVIIPRVVMSKCTSNMVYAISIYIYTDQFEEESWIDLGLYGDKDNAELQVQQVQQMNMRLTANRNVSVEWIIDKYILGDIMWKEGYKTDQEGEQGKTNY